MQHFLPPLCQFPLLLSLCRFPLLIRFCLRLLRPPPPPPLLFLSVFLSQTLRARCRMSADSPGHMQSHTHSFGRAALVFFFPPFFFFLNLSVFEGAGLEKPSADGAHVITGSLHCLDFLFALVFFHISHSDLAEKNKTNVFLPA